MMNSDRFCNCTFAEFFKRATHFDRPYPYQEKLATSDLPDILNIPTGAGKTESAILCMWLWRRRGPDKRIRAKTPRRLIYCLPMRTLVEQTVNRTKEWIENLKLKDPPKIITLMGGSLSREYRKYPECDMIIIGTQDMLLSRALNRGYATSVFAWPTEFGLLNNDCMWVMDEIQLMHNGLTTSVQLDAFRSDLGTCGPHKTVWMSATIDRNRLDTIDSGASTREEDGLSKADHMDEFLEKRNTAKKTLRITDLTKNGNEYTRNEAQKIMAKHMGGVTLAITNTVGRAQSLYVELHKLVSSYDSNGKPRITLIHSRFRKQERQNRNDYIAELSASPKSANAIIVATQVVEAGIDISARTLITEVAPWSSLVQRFGRCNRKGEYSNADIHIIKLDMKKCAAPYDEDDLRHAEDILKKIEGTSMSPVSVPGSVYSQSRASHIPHVVLRKPHLIDLFDTTPDLSGNYTDISRYVRSMKDEQDVHVFWRQWDTRARPPDYEERGDETCSVPIYDIRCFISNGKKYPYRHDPVVGKWIRVSKDDVRPGQTILFHCNAGGYDNDLGWSPKSTMHVIETAGARQPKQSADSIRTDPQSETGTWVTLNDHTTHVRDELKVILRNIEYLDKLAKQLDDAAIFHDAGKVHKTFQDAILKGSDRSPNEFWAKRMGKAGRYERDNFRHEAASALAVLKNKGDSDPATCLVAYLVASHHGKVRMSMRTTQTMWKENTGNIPNTQYIAGIPTDWEDTLPIFLYKPQQNGKDVIRHGWATELRIKADIARIGISEDRKRSWLQITQELLAKYGPFRLAFLEAVIRAADGRASAKEERNEPNTS